MRSSKYPLALLASLSIACSTAFSQAPLNSEIQISKIEANLIDSPKINVGGYSKKAPGRPGQWLEVEVTFDRAPNPKSPLYADELTFNYYILLKNEADTEDRKPTLLTGSVTHVHVAQGKGLHAVAFVSPKTLARFFAGKVPVNAQAMLVDYGVTVTGKEGLLAIATSKGSVKGDKGWWDNPIYAPTAGFVLSKDQTPFAPLEWDFYEAVKPSAKN